MNRCYVVHADIIDATGRQEKFSALCYAGHLPGFCMTVNDHGLVYSINIIEPVRVMRNKTRRLPTKLYIELVFIYYNECLLFVALLLARHFIARALITARNLFEAQTILRDPGTGSAHGFCVNMAFTKQVTN